MINEFHNMRAVPLPERETFNNTVLLLTMVKSEYYYIVGFSRPDRMIEIAFDFDSELHDSLCESMTLDFGTDEENVILCCDLKNLDLTLCDVLPQDRDGRYGRFLFDGAKMTYEYRVRKDRLIPVGMEQMHEHILKAKFDIVGFLEKYYSELLAQ